MTTTFEWDGQRFELLDDPDDWEIEEIAQVEQAFGMDLADMRSMMRSAAALAVSIRRQRPGFPARDALRLKVAVLQHLEASTVRPPIVGETLPDIEPGVVLSPTRAGSVRKRVARKRPA